MLLCDAGTAQISMHSKCDALKKNVARFTSRNQFPPTVAPFR